MRRAISRAGRWRVLWPGSVDTSLTPGERHFGIEPETQDPQSNPAKLGITVRHSLGQPGGYN